MWKVAPCEAEEWVAPAITAAATTPEAADCSLHSYVRSPTQDVGSGGRALGRAEFRKS